jgi:hypothetical protein
MDQKRSLFELATSAFEFGDDFDSSNDVLVERSQFFSRNPELLMS